MHGKIVPSFATFSPELTNNVPATVLSGFGPPRRATGGMVIFQIDLLQEPGFYRSSIQKPTIPLVYRLLVLIPKAVAWLRCYHALQERVPKRWALSYHYLTNPFLWLHKSRYSSAIYGPTDTKSGRVWLKVMKINDP